MKTDTHKPTAIPAAATALTATAKTRSTAPLTRLCTALASRLQAAKSAIRPPRHHRMQLARRIPCLINPKEKHIQEMFNNRLEQIWPEQVSVLVRFALSG